MPGNMQEIVDSLKRIRSLSLKAQLLFTILFILFCVGGFIMLCLAAFNLANPGLLPFETTLELDSFALLFVSLAVWSVFFLTARSIFKEMGAGRTPFTFVHAKRLKRLGWLFVADFILSLLIPAAYSIIGQPGSLDAGYIVFQITSSSIASFDLTGLIGAVVCFTLSTIWRYGALLQAESDETF